MIDRYRMGYDVAIIKETSGRKGESVHNTAWFEHQSHSIGTREGWK